MKYIFNILLLLSTLLTLSGCDTGLNAGNRSGNIDDDYVEEPLSNFSSKYENALLTSNQVLEMLKNKEYENIHNKYVHKSMKNTLTANAFESMQNQVSDMVGAIKTFKPMQWGFLTAEEAGKDILFSFKVIEHDKTTLNYAFVFENDKQYKKIIGFQINERNGPRFPNSTQ